MAGIVLIGLISVAGPAFAQNGRILDSRSNAPVANAEVSILGQAGSTRTDAQGRFTWQPVPVPPFEVLVVLPGGRVLKPVLVTTLATGGQFTVSVTPLVSSEMTVSAPAAPDIRTTPANGVTLLGGREMTSRAPANLTQALENVAGVTQVSEGQAAVPAVRGLARGRTLILIDGGRVSAERRVGPSATFLDPFSLESVEVSRGPGSVAYGSDAFGGVILARTRRVAPNTPWAGRFTGTIGAGIPEQRGALEVSKGFSGGSVLAQVHMRQADDYDSPSGEVFNSGWRDQGFLLRTERTFGRGIVSAGWQSDFGRDVERPRNNSRTTRFYYPTENSHRFTASYDLFDVAGFRRMGVNAFLGSNHVITDQDRFPTATVLRRIERADVAARDFHVRGFVERLFGETKVEAGLDVNGRFGLEALDVIVDYNSAGAVSNELVNVSVDAAHRTDVGAYLMADSRLLPRLSVAAGLRADRVTTVNNGGYFGDRDSSHTASSGYGSATVDAGAGVSVTGQISRGFRDPVLSDRYFRGPSGRGFITGNPDLDPETSLQADAGVRYTRKGLRVGVFLYQYRLTDLIERYSTQTDFFFFRNRGKARIRGVEFEATATLPSAVTVEVIAQSGRGRALDDNANLDDIGTDTFIVQVRKDIGTRTFAALRVATYARDSRPGPTEVQTTGYTLVNASAGFRLARALELQLHARNLGNNLYMVSPDARAVPAPGRSLTLSAHVTF